LLRYAQPPAFREDIASLLRGALAKTTGEPWRVERVIEEGAPTLVEREDQRKHAAAEAVRSAPLVAATLAAFPQAELIEDDRQAASGGGNGNWRR
jgi:DNA polymerase-3 subunit gamma/tau